MAMRIGPTASVLLPPVPEVVELPLSPGIEDPPPDSDEPPGLPAVVGPPGPPGVVGPPVPPASVDSPDPPPVFMPVPVFMGPPEIVGPVGSPVCIDPLCPLSVIEDTVGPPDIPDIIPPDTVAPDIPDIIPVLAVFCAIVVIGAQVKSAVSIYPELHVTSHLSFPFKGQLSLQFLSQMV